MLMWLCKSAQKVVWPKDKNVHSVTCLRWYLTIYVNFYIILICYLGICLLIAVFKINSHHRRVTMKEQDKRMQYLTNVRFAKGKIFINPTYEQILKYLSRREMICLKASVCNTRFLLSCGYSVKRRFAMYRLRPISYWVVANC